MEGGGVWTVGEEGVRGVGRERVVVMVEEVVEVNVVNVVNVVMLVVEVKNTVVSSRFQTQTKTLSYRPVTQNTKQHK